MPGVLCQKEGAVGMLTLDEPSTLNAMTPALLESLTRAIGELTADASIRAIVLTGAGRGFCSGQNLRDQTLAANGLVAGVMKSYWPAFKALRECAVPVVVAVNGVAAGGGFSLAMCGDFVLAARSASFIQVFSRIGLVPDLGSTWLMPRLLGRQRALQLMLLNEPCSAERAKEWGLVYEVHEDAELASAARELAQRLAEGPTRALIATRRLVDESGYQTFADQFQQEIELQSELREGPDAIEGRAAFTEKRKARFVGR